MLDIVSAAMRARLCWPARHAFCDAGTSLQPSRLGPCLGRLGLLAGLALSTPGMAHTAAAQPTSPPVGKPGIAAANGRHSQGAQARAWRGEGKRVVIDPVASAQPMRPGGARADRPPTAPASVDTTPLAPAPAHAAAPAPAPSPDVAPAASRGAVRQPAAPSAAALPDGDGPISVGVAPLPDGEPGATLPFQDSVGAAAFRRGDRAFLVFDMRQPLDFSQVAGDPILGAAKLDLLPAATVVSFPLAPNASLRLEHSADGWVLRLGAPRGATLPPIHQDENEVVFGLADPAHAVVVPDPESNAALLVGTVRPRSGPGAALAISRRTPSFRILPAWLGMAIQASSDRVELSARAEGFALHVPAPLLSPVVPQEAALANAAALTRVFDFPDLPTPALLRRMDDFVAAAATAPVRARLSARLAAAQAMIALGLASEADGLIAAARSENPLEGQSLAAALQALARLLDGREDRAGALNDPDLGDSDELNFWRAAAMALKDEHSPAAAAAFAATFPLVAAYPQALRERLLPLVAETLVLGGQDSAADALLARFPDDRALFLVRALRLDRTGEAEKALALYDQLAADRDRLVRVRAGVEAAELRHRLGQLDAGATADALEHLLFEWRGDQRELALRLRVADLRAQAGKIIPALQFLQETQLLFPKERETIDSHMGQMLETLLVSDQVQSLKPLELISLIKEFSSYVPSGAAGGRLAALLADRLVALDLPDQASTVLEQLMRAAPEGMARARFGLQLAKMRIESGKAADALAALHASEAPDLSLELSEERGLTLARAQSQSGDLSGAVSTLFSIGTASADDLRASLLEAAKDWHGALAALRDLAAKRIGAEGPLTDEQQEIAVRQASAALQAGDTDTLVSLRQELGPRMGTGPRADLFRLLTGRPVQSSTEIPSVARDVELARQVPETLQSLSSR